MNNLVALAIIDESTFRTSAIQINTVNCGVIVVSGPIQMSTNENPLRYVLGWLITGTRGGTNRAKIIKTLRENPKNANQLAILLKVDYRTVRHHLEVLQRNRLIISVGDRYGATYFLSPAMEANYALFEEIMNKFWEKEKREEK
ncbi:MAG: winged helix-turn-helix domain-containing protein [Nitrososphaeria archaeon]